MMIYVLREKDYNDNWYDVERSCNLEDIWAAAENLIDRLEDFHDEFNELLDECFDEFKIGDIHYSPSFTFYKVDPVAYQTEYQSYLDNQYQQFYEDLKSDIDVLLCNVEVLCKEEE